MLKSVLSSYVQTFFYDIIDKLLPPYFFNQSIKGARRWFTWLSAHIKGPGFNKRTIIIPVNKRTDSFSGKDKHKPQTVTTGLLC